MHETLELILPLSGRLALRFINCPSLLVTSNHHMNPFSSCKIVLHSMYVVHDSFFRTLWVLSDIFGGIFILGKSLFRYSDFDTHNPPDFLCSRRASAHGRWLNDTLHA